MPSEQSVGYSNSVIALYGNDKHHFELRQFVADYLQAEMKFYKQFITNPPGPEAYVRNLRTEKVWADDIELQTMSEIYDCSIEIYADSTKPIKIFNENPQAITMRVRLHYVGRCHYDVIWDTRRNNYPLQNHYFGEIERVSVLSAQQRCKTPESVSKGSSELSAPTRASRLHFEKVLTKHMIQAAHNSLSTLEKDFDRSSKEVMREQETQMTEEEILKAVMAQSIKDAYSSQKKPTNSQQKMTTTNPITGEVRCREVAAKPDLALVIHLTSMGFNIQEINKAICQLPTTATLSQVVDKIQENREFCLYLP